MTERSRIRTFEEWVAALDESKKGVLPDFIAKKVSGKDEKHKEAEDKGDEPKKEKKGFPFKKKDKKED